MRTTLFAALYLVWCALWCVLLLALSVRIAQAQFIGESGYAAMSDRFPGRQYLDHVSNSPLPAISVLWRTFGEDKAVIALFCKEQIERATPHLVQIHLTNESARRLNRRDGQIAAALTVAGFNKALEEGLPSVVDETRARLREIGETVDKYCHSLVRKVVSIGLEDAYTPAAAEVLIRLSREELPGWLVSSNPLRGNRRGTADLLEKHDRYARGLSAPCIANHDGFTLSAGEARRFRDNSVKAGCLAAFFWSELGQGRTGNQYIPIAQRRYRFPQSYLNSRRQLMEGK